MMWPQSSSPLQLLHVSSSENYCIKYCTFIKLKINKNLQYIYTQGFHLIHTKPYTHIRGYCILHLYQRHSSVLYCCKRNCLQSLLKKNFEIKINKIILNFTFLAIGIWWQWKIRISAIARTIYASSIVHFTIFVIFAGISKFWKKNL